MSPWIVTDGLGSALLATGGLAPGAPGAPFAGSLVVGGYGSLPLVTGGLGAGPSSPAPATLAGAIAQACAGSAALAAAATGGVFNAQAKDGASVAVGPYVVFRVNSAALGMITSDSKWHDLRVKFDCTATAADSADAMAAALVALFEPAGGAAGGISLAWSTGVTTPLVRSDFSQAAPPGRGKGTPRIFRACVEYRAFARQGVPGG